MTKSPLRPEFFQRYDETPDSVFYRPPRLVKHIDEPACAALAAFYRSLFPAGGRVLDLMSSWVSHLPADVVYDQVVAMGMNAEELAANPQADFSLIVDLNKTPVIPFPDAYFDGAALAVSVQYLTAPAQVFAEVGRVLKPGAPFAIAYSNRLFPTKAVAIWQSLSDTDRASLINMYFNEAGLFEDREFRDISPYPGRSDPLYVIVGRKQGAV